MSKKDIHPKMSMTKIVMTNGDVFEVPMCVAENSTKVLSVDCHSHRAWQGNKGRSLEDQAQKIRNRYSYGKKK